MKWKTLNIGTAQESKHSLRVKWTEGQLLLLCFLRLMQKNNNATVAKITLEINAGMRRHSSN